MSEKKFADRFGRRYFVGMNSEVFCYEGGIEVTSAGTKNYTATLDGCRIRGFYGTPDAAALAAVVDSRELYEVWLDPAVKVMTLSQVEALTVADIPQLEAVGGAE